MLQQAPVKSSSMRCARRAGRSIARLVRAAAGCVALVGVIGLPEVAIGADPHVIPYDYSDLWWRDRMLIAPCYPYVSCAAYQRFEAQERRREALHELAREQARRAEPPRPLHIAPANPENIKPEYSNSGAAREEFSQSGKPLQ